MAVVQRGTALYASDGVTGDQFGRSVAVSSNGAVMAVGAPFRDSGGQTDNGGVYIYDWSGSAWVQRGSVLVQAAPEYDARYGYGMALSSNGTVLAIGAPNAVHGSYYGVVYVYDWSGSAWVLRGMVTANTANNSDYGAVIALSGNGLVLAVGDYWNAGFYIYDWSGSAWVQRGGLLTSPSFYNIGGNPVALSNDGAILAAGNSSYTSGGINNRGAVVLYDYAAGSWTERAALVLAADAVANDFLGSSVSLSSDGTTLYAGTNGYDGAGSNIGKAYAFSYSGSAWTATDTLLASDGTSLDTFGDAIALSNNGLVVAVGATGWEGAVTDQGAVYVFDVVFEVVSAPTSLLVAYAGTVTAPTRVDVAAPSAITAPSDLTVVRQTWMLSAPTSLSVTATGPITAPTGLALVDLSQHWPLWSARVTVGGVDISTLLTGTIEVDADEGAARVAHFSIQPGAGTIAPLDYVGSPVTIDYLHIISGATVAQRLFTGRIDTPRYDLNSRTLAFDCVDDLQNRVAALDRGTINLLVGGKYTTAVQGDILDNWAYAQARLETVAGSLDAGAHGDLRVTPWVLASTWATFTDADLLFDKSALSFPQRSTLVNKVEASFQYRYPRLRQRYASSGWSGTHIDMAPNGYQYPTQQDVLGAAGGSGWQVVLGVFYPAPAKIPHSSGGFIYPAEGSIDMAILWLTQRHSQTVTETFTLTVRAPESIAANGMLTQSTRGALESKFDGNAWESALDVAPLMPTGGDMDYAPDAPRSDADYAIQTLLEQAQVKILGSHRSARVGNAVLLNADLDLDKRVALSTPDFSGSGKVARVRHLLDLAAGSAITEFEIACFGVGGAGILAPSALTPPASPDAAVDTEAWGDAIPSLGVANYGITPYSDAFMGLLLNPPQEITVEDIPGVGSKSFPNPFYVPGAYPFTGFRVQMPGVADSSRNPVENTASQAYTVVIPTDALTITIP